MKKMQESKVNSAIHRGGLSSRSVAISDSSNEVKSLQFKKNLLDSSPLNDAMLCKQGLIQSKAAVNAVSDQGVIQCGRRKKKSLQERLASWREKVKKGKKGIRIGKDHLPGGKVSSKKKLHSVSTLKLAERLHRHADNYLAGKVSKFNLVGEDGQDFIAELQRATKEKQELKGSRRIRIHKGVNESEGAHAFEEGNGNMSETDESDSE